MAKTAVTDRSRPPPPSFPPLPASVYRWQPIPITATTPSTSTSTSTFTFTANSSSSSSHLYISTTISGRYMCKARRSRRSH
ncbi:unnamed protein product [Thelazia callipaeda]|uniref:Ig-like domain-containing protein n=1 Tax=Thelazia callipaeda TaxID=103827 RepID=A0A0N5D7I0_THECL|nr:unnamed protein product [Thelazia callipaeda]